MSKKNNEKYTKKILESAVKDSYSIMEVLRKLGVAQSGGWHTYITNRIKEFKIDTSHMLGKSSNRKKQPKNKLKPEDILKKILSGKRERAILLKRSMLELGKIYKCYKCSLSTWLGEDLSLQVHHLNGDGSDNRLENLEFICPNCHSQTDNFSGRKTKHVEYRCLDCGKIIRKNKSHRCWDCYKNHEWGCGEMVNTHDLGSCG